MMSQNPWRETRTATTLESGRLGWQSQWKMADWPVGFEAWIYQQDGARWLRLEEWTVLLYNEKVATIREGKKIAEAVLAVIKKRKETENA